jgi:hypothetical protein
LTAKRYVALLRGINVGGKNKVAMADLRDAIESHGCRRRQGAEGFRRAPGHVPLRRRLPRGPAHGEAGDADLELREGVDQAIRSWAGVTKILALLDEPAEP